MTRACDFDCVAPGSCGIPLFEVRIDGSIFCRCYDPTRFAPPRRRVVMTALSLLAALNTSDRAIKAASSTGRSATKYKLLHLTRGWAAMKFAGLCTLFMVSLQH